MRFSFNTNGGIGEYPKKGLDPDSIADGDFQPVGGGCGDGERVSHEHRFVSIFISMDSRTTLGADDYF